MLIGYRCFTNHNSKHTGLSLSSGFYGHLLPNTEQSGEILIIMKNWSEKKITIHSEIKVFVYLISKMTTDSFKLLSFIYRQS